MSCSASRKAGATVGSGREVPSSSAISPLTTLFRNTAAAPTTSKTFSYYAGTATVRQGRPAAGILGGEAAGVGDCGVTLGYPMANQHQTFAWYRAPISYQFSLCRRLIGTLTEHIESHKEETLAAWAESAESISDPVIREEVWVHLASEGHDFDILNQLTFRALFVASVSLFEFELLRICNMAQRHSNNQEPTIDPYKFNLRKAKGCLSSLEVRVSADLVEWKFVRGLRPPRWLRISSTVDGQRPVTRIVGKPAPVAREFDWIPSPCSDGFRFGV